MAKSSDKVTIKKYANRRLYDTESSSYITLDRLAQMVREGREFQVVDAKSGDDITRQVLTQIIVEEEARGSTMLPLNFLKQLIGLYGNSMQNFVPQYLEAAMDAFQRNQSAAREAFGGGNVFADLAKRNLEMFGGAATAFGGKPGPAGPTEKPSPRPGGDDVDQLRAELAALQAKVDKLKSLIDMHRLFAAAFALALGAPLSAQSIADQTQAVPLPGNWSYAATADGSEAVFADANRQPQLSLRCVRSTRRIFLSKPAAAAVPALAVWSSTATKSLPAAFDAANARLVVQIANWDPLLDAIAYSRGRFAVAAGAQQPLVVPAWADISRVVEDCRV